MKKYPKLTDEELQDNLNQFIGLEKLNQEGKGGLSSGLQSGMKKGIIQNHYRAMAQDNEINISENDNAAIENLFSHSVKQYSSCMCPYCLAIHKPFIQSCPNCGRYLMVADTSKYDPRYNEDTALENTPDDFKIAAQNSVEEMKENVKDIKDGAKAAMSFDRIGMQKAAVNLSIRSTESYLKKNKEEIETIRAKDADEITRGKNKFEDRFGYIYKKEENYTEADKLQHYKSEEKRVKRLKIRKFVISAVSAAALIIGVCVLIFGGKSKESSNVTSSQIQYAKENMPSDGSGIYSMYSLKDIAKDKSYGKSENEAVASCSLTLYRDGSGIWTDMDGSYDMKWDTSTLTLNPDTVYSETVSYDRTDTGIRVYVEDEWIYYYIFTSSV